MMQGITSLPGAQQAPQAPQGMPQAAAPQAPQQAATPMAVTGQLEKLPPQQLLAMFSNPMDKTPKWAVVSAYAKAIENQRMMDAARGQSAMQQNQAQQGQPPVAAQVMSQPIQPAEPVMARDGGIMSGYAGGGAVAFQSGGFTYGSAPDYELARKYGINLSPYDAPEVRAEKIRRAKAMAEFEEQRKSFGEIPTEASVANDAALRQAYSHPSRMRDLLQNAAPSGAAPSGAAPSNFRPTPLSPNSGGGVAALAGAQRTSQQSAPQTGDPTLERIAAQYEARQKGLEAMLQGQGEVDPELQKLREAYDKGQQGRISARDARSLEMVKRAQEAASAPMINSQEALLRLAGSLGGAKRFGEGLSMAAKEAGMIRGEQRKTLERAQELRAQEQNAIDMLNSALEEKRIADKTGDVAAKRAAALKVEESRAQLLNVRRDLYVAGEELNLKRRTTAATELSARATAASAGRTPTEERLFNKLYPAVLSEITGGKPPTPEQEKRAVTEAWSSIRGLDIRRDKQTNDYRIAQQKLLTSDEGYKTASIIAATSKDPTRVARAQATMREIERRNGIERPEGTETPSGQVDTNNPLLK